MGPREHDMISQAMKFAVQISMIIDNPRQPKSGLYDIFTAPVILQLRPHPLRAEHVPKQALASGLGNAGQIAPQRKRSASAAFLRCSASAPWASLSNSCSGNSWRSLSVQQAPYRSWHGLARHPVRRTSWANPYLHTCQLWCSRTLAAPCTEHTIHSEWAQPLH